MEILKDTSDQTGGTKHLRWNYGEFVEHSQTRKLGKNKIEESREEGNIKFYGTETYKEAVEYAEKGWDAGLKQLALEDGILVDTGTLFEPSIVGSVVNIGNYVQGLPDNMYQLRERREYNLEKLTIVFQMNYGGGNRAEKAMKYCKSINEIVNKYQAKNNVRLIGRVDNKQTNNINYKCDVIIKDFDERFVLNNIAFAFHPSFYRRIYFSHLEKEDFMDMSYGQPSSKSKISKELKEEYQDKILLMPSLGELSNGEFTEASTQKINF